MNMPRIVIIGTGFGGIYAYLTLHRLLHHSKNVEIVMISPNDFFSFSPLIHEVATGNLLPSSVIQSIRTIPHCCLDRYILGTVTAIHCDSKKIYYTSANDLNTKQLSQKSLSFDYCIIAMGSETDFHNIPGARNHVLQLKNIEDAKLIKNRVLNVFEYANTIADQQDIKKILSFAVIGGGPTGIELVAELADYINKELTRAFPALSGRASITLVHAHQHLLPQADRWFHEKIVKILDGVPYVQLKLGKAVIGIDKDGIRLEEKEYIPASTILWTAGVKAREIRFNARKEIVKDERTQRIQVNDHLQLTNYPNCFVVGDQAWICDEEKNQPYPMRAQFAIHEGVLAARNIIHSINKKKLEEFHYHDQGFIISLGNKKAIALIQGIKLSGFPAWWIYRTAYLIKMLGFRAKLRTVLEWTLNLFFPRDINRI